MIWKEYNIIKMNQIKKNIQTIRQRIKKSCEKVGRNPKEVKLLLATKTISPDIIKIAIEEGETLIGENKIQELVNKYDDLKKISHTKHFIGHLQTNKIKDLLKCEVNCIESLDKLETAEKLQKRLDFEDKTIDVLIQVNTSFEESKFGINPDSAIDFVKQVAKFDRIKIKGLMTIGLLSENDEQVRKGFQLLKKIQERIIQENIIEVEMKELSMGMSNDLEIAVEEGATIIRVGSAIFGKRNYL